MDLTALRTEIHTDPAGLGYLTDPVNTGDNAIAAKLNAASTAWMVDAGVIPAYQVLNATVPAEWTALSAAAKQQYQTLTGAGQVDSGNANVRATFAAMFAVGTVTRANLTALLQRPGSRAEVVFGAGSVVDDGAVALAR